jgi:[protein-PII] uridylyltransferase
MRIYFGHARAVQRTVLQLLEEIPEAWSSLRRQFQSWRSRPSTPDFSVVDGMIFLQQPSSLQDPEMLLRLFHFMAHHGLKLSTTTEHRIEQALPALAVTSAAWGGTLALSAGNFAAAACRRGVAGDAFAAPAHFAVAGIEADRFAGGAGFYHRFTVDEHSILAIESLHRLRDRNRSGTSAMPSCWANWKIRSCFTSRCCCTTRGKECPGVNHVEASLEIADRCLDRLDVDPSERGRCCF